MKQALFCLSAKRVSLINDISEPHGFYYEGVIVFDKSNRNGVAVLFKLRLHHWHDS
jgi:hypothetical protein